MCVGPVKDMFTPKVISNPATPAPPPPPPPAPIPIASPTMQTSKSTEQAAPDMAIKKKPKIGNPLRIDRAPSGMPSSGVNVPY